MPLQGHPSRIEQHQLEKKSGREHGDPCEEPATRGRGRGRGGGRGSHKGASKAQGRGRGRGRGRGASKAAAEGPKTPGPKTPQPKTSAVHEELETPPKPPAIKRRLSVKTRLIVNSKYADKQADNKEADNQEADHQQGDNQEADDQEANNQQGDNQEADDQEANNQEADDQEANNQKADDQEANHQKADDQEADKKETKRRRTRHSDEEKSFARRAKPKGEDTCMQWTIIRNTFNSRIAAEVDVPSKHQDTRACGIAAYWLSINRTSPQTSNIPPRTTSGAW